MIFDGNQNDRYMYLPIGSCNSAVQVLMSACKYLYHLIREFQWVCNLSVPAFLKSSLADGKWWWWGTVFLNIWIVWIICGERKSSPIRLKTQVNKMLRNKDCWWMVSIFCEKQPFKGIVKFITTRESLIIVDIACPFHLKLVASEVVDLTEGTGMNDL